MTLIKVKGLYRKPKYKKASEMIRIDTPNNARKSTRWLSSEWRKAKTRAKKRRLIKFATVAMNRARVASKNKKLSPKERREMKTVAKIYENWLREHRLRKKR